MLTLKEFIEKVKAGEQPVVYISPTSPIVKRIEEQISKGMYDVYEVRYPKVEAKEIPPPEKVVEKVVEKPVLKVVNLLPIVIFAFLSIYLMTKNE